MPIERVQSFLADRHVGYERIYHREAFTAKAEAAAADVPGGEWAKTVVVYADEKPVMALLPANRRANLERLARAAGARHVRIATETEMSDLFPESEVGAVPPFGGLWDLPVFCDECLRLHEHIAFHAGSHREAIRMRYPDFETLAEPVVADFCEA